MRYTRQTNSKILWSVLVTAVVDTLADIYQSHRFAFVRAVCVSLSGFQICKLICNLKRRKFISSVQNDAFGIIYIMFDYLLFEISFCHSLSKNCNTNKNQLSLGKANTCNEIKQKVEFKAS